MKNKIEDLRNHLFATLEGLLDESNPMDVDRARAVSEVAKTMIDSAKAETERMKLVYDLGVDAGTDFIPKDKRLPSPHLRSVEGGRDK